MQAFIWTVLNYSLLWKKVICTYVLFFNGWTGTMPSLSMTNLSSKSKNIILQWVFKSNSAPATAETWHLQGCTLKIQLTVLLLILSVGLSGKCITTIFCCWFLSFWHTLCFLTTHFPTLINFLLISLHKWWIEYTVLYVVFDGRIGKMTQECWTAKHVKEPAVAKSRYYFSIWWRVWGKPRKTSRHPIT